VIIHNDTPKSIDITEIRFARIWAKDESQGATRLGSGDWCKKISTSPGQNRMMGDALRTWGFEGEKDAWYEYTTNVEVSIDGVRSSTEESVVHSEGSHIYAITAKGMEPDKSQFNVTALCSVVIWRTTERKLGIVCPGYDMASDAKGGAIWYLTSGGARYTEQR
jgi:hypothetical protein